MMGAIHPTARPLNRTFPPPAERRFYLSVSAKCPVGASPAGSVTMMSFWSTT